MTRVSPIPETTVADAVYTPLSDDEVANATVTIIFTSFFISHSYIYTVCISHFLPLLHAPYFPTLRRLQSKKRYNIFYSVHLKTL
jgi:hypothetical protein